MNLQKRIKKWLPKKDWREIRIAVIIGLIDLGIFLIKSLLFKEGLL